MSDHHFWLSEAQFARLDPLLPNKPRGVPRVDDRRVISGIIHVIRGGLMWRDAPAVYGPPKTLYNRFIRWSRIGVFDRIFATLAAASEATDTVMIDATHLRPTAPPPACSKRGCSPAYRAHERRPELQAARGLRRRGQAIDIAPDRRPGQRLSRRRDRAARPARRQGPDRRSRLRQRLVPRSPRRPGIVPCIPGRKNRKQPIQYDAGLYKQRNRIERMFGRLKDWRRIATRYDRCAHTFMSAICIAATVIFWL